jgi:TrmH family RNA methyltransferase
MVGLARDRDIEAVVVSEDVLRAMSSSAQGVVAVAHMQASTLADVVGSEYTQSPSLRNQCLVLNQVRDPGNVGTMVRTADAVGACSVVAISGTVDLTNPKVVRSTVGSLFHVPWVSSVSLSEAVHTLKGAGYFVAASDSKGELPVEQVAEVANTRPIAWIVGNEAWGYERDERSMADAVVRIPMGGRTESLNVAVAAALCLYTVSHYLSGER